MQKEAYIVQLAKQLYETYETRDPLLLCECLDIIVCHSPMGSAEEGCKGFFAVFYGEKCITLNNRLPEDILRFVAAHELGHAVLHSEHAQMATLSDFTVFTQGSTLESEANMFAAELLLDDHEVLEVLQDTGDAYEAAKVLFVPFELLCYKLNIMRTKGYTDIKAPVAANSTFFSRNLCEVAY